VNLMIDRFRLSPASPSRAAKTCPDCFTDIPAKARRCPNCTSELSRPAVKRHRRPHKKGGTIAGNFVQQKGSTGKYHFNLGGW
jgi:predicted amidophosphoribosyltransferase